MNPKSFLSLKKMENISDLVKSNIKSYISLFFLLVISLLSTITKPSTQYVNINDPRLQYPHIDPHLDKITDSTGFILAFALPLLAILLGELVKVNFKVKKLLSKQKLEHFHGLILGFFSTSIITLAIVSVLKNWLSQPRPDFISRCQVDYKVIQNFKNIYKISDICQGDVLKIEEGLRSTPSGHSASSFAGLNYLSVYLFSKFQNISVFSLILGYSPLVLATYIATTRLSDFKHSLFDISFGCTIGVVISLYIWKLFNSFDNEEEDEQQLPL
ncbi:hypothetical protein WICMUC_003392 [Wickerhamomyces mucosus]|uniref:Phosphatidic acid phosphatase type 2/haloperoxidase domain-containing protein n=1 Tax=Wickerhamomyces mucosus TaxID=1378264 RepID=A0A9P8PMN4_9ASCO|nr:hypothetical protein WICMUC_003392 [Wickerhamomyces mucosus]